MLSRERKLETCFEINAGGGEVAFGEKIKAKSQQQLQRRAGGDVFDWLVIKRQPRFIQHVWRKTSIGNVWDVDSRLLYSPRLFLFSNNDFFFCR